MLPFLPYNTEQFYLVGCNAESVDVQDESVAPVYRV
jgi:hypothetical protein